VAGCGDVQGAIIFTCYTCIAFSHPLSPVLPLLSVAFFMSLGPVGMEGGKGGQPYAGMLLLLCGSNNVDER